MRITLRGTRGSIPVPGQQTIKYGGNTTCIEVVAASGDRVIIDAGSGIRQMGNEMLLEGPSAVTLMITHTHWDHIQGLPFFLPLFVPGFSVSMWGPLDPVYQQSLKQILSRQMEYCYFPVRESELKATLDYHNLHEGSELQVGSMSVTAILTHHPVMNYGFLFEENGKKFFFTGDHEPPVNIYPSDRVEHHQYQQMLDQQLIRFEQPLQGIDLLLADCQYTKQEYFASKIGWGHAYYEWWIERAQQLQIGHTLLTHHDPERTDKQLDKIAADLHQQFGEYQYTFALAVEGTSFAL